VLLFVAIGMWPLVSRANTTTGSQPADVPRVRVIVRLVDGAAPDSNAVVAAGGGTYEQALPVINGFSATVPADAVDALRATAGVADVTVDSTLHVVVPNGGASPQSVDTPGFVASDFATKGGGNAFGELDPSSIARVIGADKLQKSGITGAGVDVALIDSGVTPVAGVGQVVNGPDLSFDSQASGTEHLDAYGHGTHLAGIINGAGGGVNGIAPGARVVNVKVGAANGATDVSQVIAAIDWVVQHRDDNGLNIRVLNLAYGTDGLQPYALDPLAYAAEVAWRHGIVVVTAAGNRGAAASSLDNPAIDPFVIAVGSSDAKGTYSPGDDVVSPFSSAGNGTRRPDVAAPGRSVVSFRVPGSYVDATHPEGRDNSGRFRGSGTSQATAVTSGAVALLLQQSPQLTPDQVKWLLRKTAGSLPQTNALSAPAQLDIQGAATRAAPRADVAAQTWAAGTGTGSLEAARGTNHVVINGVPLTGEYDIFGTPWSGVSWSGVSWSGVSWSGGTWNGVSWSGVSWSGVSWSGVSWSGVSWSGVSWSGVSWSGVSWSGISWSGVSWSGVSWSGVSWSGVSWSGATAS